MPGSGFKTFNTGDILTAADVNGYLMKQAVMYFATATDRSTALTSPEEGMVTYLADTNRIDYYDGAAWQPLLDQDVIAAKGDLIVGTGDDTVSRLAVGTNNQVLTADSSTATGLKWAAAGGSGAMTKISASTFTSQSAVTFDNVFTSTYRNYMIVGNATAASAGQMRYRWRASGSDITATNYGNQRYDVSNTSFTGLRQSNLGFAEFAVARSSSFETGFEMMTYLPQLALPSLTFSNSLEAESSTTLITRTYTTYYNATTQMDGIKFYLDANQNFSGTIIIYGLEN